MAQAEYRNEERRKSDLFINGCEIMGKNYAGVDLTGQRFTRLVAKNLVDGHRTLWHCVCDCGKEVDVFANFLIKDIRKSCGCLNDEKRKELGKRANRTHGMANTILYSKYCGIKERCYNPNYRSYGRYGGRGIKMCDEWKQSFESFRDWAYSAGYDDSKVGYEQTLDRINTDGDYEPSNCRWTNMKTQCRNRSNSVWVEENGEKVFLYDFCKEHGITYFTFASRRIKKGKSLSDIARDWDKKHKVATSKLELSS